MAKKKPMRLRNLQVNEISTVNAGANPHAEVLLAKADPKSEYTEKSETEPAGKSEPYDLEAQRSALEGMVKSGARTFEASIALQDHEKKVGALVSQIMDRISALHASSRTIIDDKDVGEGDRADLLRQSLNDFRSRVYADVGKLVVDLLGSLKPGEDPSTSKGAAMVDVGKKPPHESPEDGSDRTDSESDEVREIEIQRLTGELAKAEARAHRAEGVALLSDVEKIHLQALDAEAQEDFLNSTPGERTQQIARAASADEVLELPGGRTVRKSIVGDEQFAAFQDMAKEVAEGREEARLEKDKRETAEFNKLAEDVFGTLPGETMAKGQALKSMQGLPDAERTTIEAMLKAGEAACLGLSTEQGHDEETLEEAEGALEQMVKRRQNVEDITYAQAYAAVLGTEEGAALYEESIAEDAER